MRLKRIRMRNCSALAVASLSLTALLAGCGNIGGPDLDEVQRAYLQGGPPSKAVVAAVTGAKEAAVKHAVKLAGEKKEGNFMISPFSYQECLGMVRLGAEGKTNSELAAWLGAESDSSITAASLRAIRDTLQPLVDAGIVTMANGVWVSKSAQIKPKYMDQVKLSFQAAVRNANFPEPALTEINAFAKETTKGRIEKTLEELDPLSRMVLVNAIHFKDKWTEPFKKERTKEEPFNAPGVVQIVPMMHGYEGFSGARKGGYLFAGTSFKTGLRVIFALPPSKDKPVESCFAPLMEVAGTGLDLEVSEVALPKFRSEFTWNMTPTMQSMGVRAPFDRNLASFGPMSQEPLFISQIVQKTFVQFDEEGVEAAAVTATEMAAGAEAPTDDEPISFIADRPYAYVILDKNGMPLFLGLVRDPTKD